MKGKIALSFLILALSVFALSAEPYYDRGSQIFTITLGTNVPTTATINDQGKTTTFLGPFSGPEKTNITMGGYGGLDYEFFVNPVLSLGGELGYQFNFASSKLLTFVPILFKMTYVPFSGRFDLPISFGFGINYMSYNNSSMITMFMKLEVGFRYFITENWGIGLVSGFTYVPEVYADKPQKNGQFTYVPINVAVYYRH